MRHNGRRFPARSRHAGRSPARLGRAAFRWLRADAEDVVDVEADGDATHEEADGDATHEEADGDATHEEPPGGLLDGLDRWRRRVERRRAVAVVRRQLIVAFCVAVVLGVLARGFGLGGAIAIVPPVAIAVAGLAYALSRRTSVERVALLLDERLGLAERLGTALEIVRRRPSGRLETRVIDDASRAVSVGLVRSAARVRRLRGEWTALLVAAALVAALGLAVPTIELGGAPGADQPRGGADGARAGDPTVADASRLPNARRTRGPAALGNLPTGASPYGGAFRSNTTTSGLDYESPSSAPPVPGGAEAAGAAGAGSQRSGGAAGDRAALGDDPSSRSGERQGTGEVRPVGEPGASRPDPGAGGSPRRGSSSPPAGQPGESVQSSGIAGDRPGAGAGRGPQEGAGGVRVGGSRGGRTAGGQPGDIRPGPRRPSTATSGPRPLPLQAGFQPGGAAGRATGRGSGSGGGRGGGPIRRLGGEAAPAPAAFPYVPPDRGAVPGSLRGLLLDYLDALTRLSAGR